MPAIKRKRGYVAGAYRASTQDEVIENIQRARDVARDIVKYGWKSRWYPYTPHLNTGGMEDLAPDTFLLDWGLSYLAICHAVVLVPGWEKSLGAIQEIKKASQLGIPMYETPEFMAMLKDGLPIKGRMT